MAHPFKHFHTITKHRHKVIHFCFKVGVGWQGLRHDLSKYSPTEFWSGAHYYTGTHSPITEERKVKGYSEAWLHHKGRNRHHFEYWTFYSSAKRDYVPVKMPLRYVKEMLADRVAASMVYNGKNYTDDMPLDYLINKGDLDGMHEETAKLITEWLTLVKEKGHNKAFKIIKNVKSY